MGYAPEPLSQVTESVLIYGRSLLRTKSRFPTKAVAMTQAITELRTVSWHQCDNFIVLTLDKAYTLYFLLVSEIFEATLKTLWPFLGEIWNNLSLYKKIVSESSEAVFFDRLWEKSETTFIKVFRKFLKQHFVTVFRRYLRQSL